MIDVHFFRPGTGKSCLLLALLEKPVNSSGGLRRAISQNLTEFEVATLIERLIFFIYEKESEQTLDKVLNLLRVLIDSHSLRFIWDEQCHEKLQKAASVVTDLVSAFFS
ncbi:unnamed protein product [Gongylonema pulchrum]|uniref:Uncharacterized protein n=1 Tax=Gongylonema pulchrum TaxID=637853 RepID=A0A3P6SUL2_9BILA|nr:unnamed protein product [Gongylonema pulchrum]